MLGIRLTVGSRRRASAQNEIGPAGAQQDQNRQVTTALGLAGPVLVSAGGTREENQLLDSAPPSVPKPGGYEQSWPLIPLIMRHSDHR